MRMETFTHPYALVRLYLCGISWLYKEFTLSVQCKCANYTTVYNATYVEGFQMLLKKLLAHLFFLRGTLLIDIPHFSLYTFIGWDNALMMNRNLNWVSFSPFSVSHDIGTWLTRPYALVLLYLGRISATVQGIYTKCTRPMY